MTENSYIRVKIEFMGTHGPDRENIEVEVERNFAGPSQVQDVADEAVKRIMHGFFDPEPQP